MNKLRMSKMSEEEQLKDVLKKGFNIGYIDNPSEKFCLEILKEEPFAIADVNPELITQEMLDITKGKCNEEDWNDYNKYLNGEMVEIPKKELENLRFENIDLKNQINKYKQEHIVKKVDASDTEKYNEKVSKSFKTNRHIPDIVADALEEDKKDEE